MPLDHRARLRLAAQNGAARALVTAESPDQAIGELLREVCENLGWAVGGFWFPDATNGVIRRRAVWTDSAPDVDSFAAASRDAKFERGVGLPGQVWASGHPRWITDVVTEPGFVRADAARAAGVHGAFAVPVPLNDDLTGVLEFFTRDTLDPDPELLETMVTVGGQLGLFMQRSSAEAALRASEEQFKTFGSTVPDVTFVIDEASRIVYINEAVRHTFGYSPSELVGAPLTRLLAERHRVPHLEKLGEFLAPDSGSLPRYRVDVEGLRRDGSEVPLEISYGSFDSDGRRFFTGIARDMTERRRSEERLRFQARLLDAVGEAVTATDRDGKVLYWNAFAERLYGWTAEEALGRDIQEVKPTALPEARSRQIIEAVADGQTWTGEVTVRARDGHEFPVLFSDSPILDDDGNVAGVIGTSIDITDRKRRENGQRFLAEASRVLASSLDYATTLRSVATLAVPDLGDWCLVHLRNAEDDVVTPVARVVDSDETEAADELEALLSGQPGIVDAVIAGNAALIAPGDHGSERLDEDRLAGLGVISLLTVPIRARGSAVGTMTFASTRPDRRYDEPDAELAEELGRRAGLAIDNARLFREAEEGNRAKTDFLAVVSHELRTPLNAIAGYADLLAGGIAGELSTKQQHHVERIKVGAGHLAHLIDEILSYARVETGRDEVRLRDTDLAALARDAVVVLEPDAVGKGLDLQVDTPDGEVVALTDAGKVRQIMVNLLSNAVKYTERGSVRLVLRRTEGGLEIQVRDTGIGIPDDMLERIFEPFWQAEAPNTRTVGGTGLGLSVSRRLARLLDGSVEVESEVGVGSTFTVRLPDLQEQVTE